MEIERGVVEYGKEHKISSKTRADRQEEMKSYTHDTNTCKQANRYRMCIRDTEAIIGKAPRLGTHI